MNDESDKSIQKSWINPIFQGMIVRFLRQLALMAFSCLAAGAVTAALAQSPTIAVDVFPDAPGRLLIEAAGPASQSWSFRDSYAGIVGLGSRIKNFKAFDARGQQLDIRVLAPGQFESTAPAARIQYEVNTVALTRSSEAAFISWLTADRGILHLSDILPVNPSMPTGRDREPVSVRLKVPEGWAAYSDEEVTALRTLRFVDLSGAVIVLGKDVRRSVRSESGTVFKVLTDGDWAFSGEEVLDTVAKIVKLHSEAGPVPCGQVTLALASFSGIAADNWSAETRGCTVTLLMGKVPSKTAALAQLGNALTHELFHLWIPNGVELTGDYDWFYEGFTMYQAARAAVRLGYISFPEFLNAIARAYDGSQSLPGTQPMSLREASKQRWTGEAASVYSKAMVVAFVYDLNLRSQSAGKRSLAGVYRGLVRQHSRSSS